MGYKHYVHPSYSYVNVVEVPRSGIRKIDFALCKQPTETPDAYYKRQNVKPDIITNGGFFSMSNGVTCFTYKDDNKVISTSDVTYGVGVQGDKELHYGSMMTSYRDYISAYPPLVEVGVIKHTSIGNEINYKARRTAIGWNNDTLFIVTVDSPGLRFDTLAKIFKDLGAMYAANLDGGGSTRMLLDGKAVTKSTGYIRPVDNVFCVYLNKDTTPTKTLYRVQVGAFTVKANADNMKARLTKDGYTNVFITQDDKYYRVQVGAFSVKLNAERLKEQLIAKGYSAIIKALYKYTG